eukprot:365214-Chlamydomonas_euryale.AAC.14
MQWPGRVGACSGRAGWGHAVAGQGEGMQWPGRVRACSGRAGWGHAVSEQGGDMQLPRLYRAVWRHGLVVDANPGLIKLHAVMGEGQPNVEQWCVWSDSCEAVRLEQHV